jgi:FkbM family methyltransferase
MNAGGQAPERVRMFAADIRSIFAVGGPATGCHYLYQVARHLPDIARSGSPLAVDRSMRGRLWRFRPLPGVEVVVTGDAFGGAREMYCRRVYFARPGFAPRPGDRVVDLGANLGLFTVLAAKAGAGVIAVEAQRGFGPLIAEHCRLNAVGSSVQVLHAIVGGTTGVIRADGGGHGAGSVPTVTVGEVIDRAGFDRVDLMKIDVEGAEFDLIDEDGWLERVDRLVLEVHPPFGDPVKLLRRLSEAGFACDLLDNAMRSRPALGQVPTGFVFALRLRPPARSGSGHRRGR